MDVRRLRREFVAAGLLVCLLAPAQPLWAHQSNGAPLTLEAALAYARQHSPLLAASKQDATTQQEAIALAKAQRLPRVDTGAAFRASNQITETALGFPLSSLADVPIQPFRNSHLNAHVSATVDLDTGGRIAAATRLAEAQRTVAELSTLDVQRDLDFRVTSDYARLVELDRDAQAARESVNALNETRRIVAQMLAVGKVARLDVLKIDARLADVRATLVDLTDAWQIRAGQLNALMGRRVDLPVTVETTLSERAVTVSIDQAVQAAAAQNAKYQLALAQIDVARRSVEQAQSQLRPSLSLAAGLYDQGADPYTAFKVSVIAGIVLSFPLLDRTLHYSVQEAQSRELERRLQLDQVRLDAMQQARAAYLRVQDADERVRATEPAIQYAREALRIEQEKQRYGRGTIEHLLDAQATLLNTEAGYYRGLADYTTAVADLTRETGLQF